MNESLSNLTLLAIEAALQAGDIVRQGYGTHLNIQHKEGRHNLVTEFDHLAEKSIVDFLSQHAPLSRFLAEESGKGGTPDAELLWIIDPLDGTVNFAHQVPHFAVSIAAVKKGVTLAGVIFQPLTHELFVAEKGVGAFLNGARLKVSKVSDLEKSFLATGFPYNLHENPHHCIDHFVDLLKLGLPVRRLGAATLDFAYVAAGRFEAFFEVSLAPWDCAAGVLLVQEAGGEVSSWDRKPFDLHSYKPVLATNGALHAPLSAVLTREVP